jgi:hypothetical protein
MQSNQQLIFNCLFQIHRIYYLRLDLEDFSNDLGRVCFIMRQNELVPLS